ncbi:hypothetical protein EPN15_03400 [Patescibacteria group bacterium]|nr:MAG: hypothetical protein EPN15_03400 [Patescibacteria group bacterium]
MKRLFFFIFILFCLSFAALTVYAASQILVTVGVNPLNVDADAKGNLRVGKIFTLQTRIENKGDAALQYATAELFAPKEIELVSGSSQEFIGEIKGGRHKDVRWKLKAALSGQYIATVRAQGINEGGDSVSSEDSILLDIREPRGLGAIFEIFSRLAAMFDN